VVVVLVSVAVCVVVPQLQDPQEKQLEHEQPPHPPQPHPQPSLSASITSEALVRQTSSEPPLRFTLAAMKERASLLSIPSMPSRIIGSSLSFSDEL
jgi:hypothetical protein